eukprot:4141092-Prymnesium_polylepis.1
MNTASAPGLYDPEKKTVNLGVPSVAPFTVPAEDRNRTSPFPYGGHRFEFRAVGSSQARAPRACLRHTRTHSTAAHRCSVRGATRPRSHPPVTRPRYKCAVRPRCARKYTQSHTATPP